MRTVYFLINSASTSLALTFNLDCFFLLGGVTGCGFFIFIFFPTPSTPLGGERGLKKYDNQKQESFSVFSCHGESSPLLFSSSLGRGHMTFDFRASPFFFVGKCVVGFQNDKSFVNTQRLNASGIEF